MDWAVAVRGRLAQMANPVVRVYSTASLAHVVCRVDSVAASGLYRTALTGLFTVPSTAWNERATTPLPVASFSGLWKAVAPAAVECDPGLASASQNDDARQRLANERAGANARLTRAYDMIYNATDKADVADRTAQLARGALEAGDPDTLNTPLLSQVLSLLVTPAPELTDDLFINSLDFVMSAKVPSPDSLQDLARFLLTAPKYVSADEDDQPSEQFTIRGVSIDNLAAARASMNPENVQALLEAVLKVANEEAAANRNPIVCYALLDQLIPRAREYAQDKVADLEKALVTLENSYPGTAAQVAPFLKLSQTADPSSGDPAARNFWLVGQVQAALAAADIERAHDMAARIDEAGVRAQVNLLITFREAEQAVTARSEMAIALVNQLRPGIKRSLLYIHMIGRARTRDDAVQVLPLAARDIAQLPAEQRLRLQAALAAGLAGWDPEASYTTLGQLVVSYNDVRANPRRGRFDPASVRRIFNPRSDGTSDSSLILSGNRGFYEAVQSQRGRHNFGLKVSNVTALSLDAFLADATKLDPDRLAAAIQALRDETTLAAAWVRLAEVRLRQ